MFGLSFVNMLLNYILTHANFHTSHVCQSTERYITDEQKRNTHVSCLASARSNGISLGQHQGRPKARSTGNQHGHGTNCQDASVSESTAHSESSASSKASSGSTILQAEKHPDSLKRIEALGSPFLSEGKEGPSKTLLASSDSPS